MTTKHTTVILPNAEIEDLKKQVAKLTDGRDYFKRQLILSQIKAEKMKCLMNKEQLDKVFSEK